jgi:hypothetical protein
MEQIWRGAQSWGRSDLDSEPSILAFAFRVMVSRHRDILRTQNLLKILPVRALSEDTKRSPINILRSPYSFVVVVDSS